MLHAAAAVAAAIVIATWTYATGTPWMLTAILASLVASAYALVWILVASPRSAQGGFGEASAVAAGAAGVVLLIGEVTAILAAAAEVPPPFPAIVAAHVVNLSAILALTWWRRWRHVAALAVVPAMFALIVQTGGAGQLATEWPRLLALACAIYAVFTAYPLLLARRARGERGPYIAAVLASALVFFAANIEIADFFATGPAIVFRFGVTVSQDLTYTIGWLVFGMALLAVCIYLHNRPGRITALALIAMTTFKCFLYDLGSIGGLYRVGSFVGLAVSLALVSIALQKYVLARPEWAR